MDLIIVESPTKATTLKRFLGAGFNVKSSYGHIRDLPKNELGVDVKNNFKPKYIIIPKAKKNVGSLKKEADRANLIILATDEDREGEAIAWHLVQALGLNELKNQKSRLRQGFGGQAKAKNYQRIAFHEITKTAILEALKNPRTIDMNLVDAQQARRILDRIVGYKLSPFLWKKVARGLSAGRVQSVAVRLIVEREREIENFIKQEYWSIEAELKKNTYDQTLRSFLTLLVKKDGKTIPKLGIKNKKEADKIVKDLGGAEYKVENIEKKEAKKNPLPPLTTSTLQQEAWRKLRFPAKLTMGLAQNLYEKGYITYHRTDSLNLSDLSLFAAKKFIIENYGKEYWAGFFRKYKARGRVQEAHEAIRPAYPERTPEKLKTKATIDDRQLRLYDLIWRRFTACQMSQACFDSTTIDILAKNPAPYRTEGSGAGYTFRTTGQILKFDGFLKIYPLKFEETDLPSLEKNDILKLIKLLSSQHFTQPPPRYNEATLIKVLEENGIGRPSTYAPILSTIQERNYAAKDESKRFYPTEIGIIVNDLLVKHFPEIVDIKFTAEMEEDLDKIAEGRVKWIPIIKEFYTPFEKNLEQKYQEVSKKDFTEKPTEKKCQKCGAPVVIRLGKFGKFYACSQFPKCRYTESLEENTLGIKCPKCKNGDIVGKRTKRKKIFYGCNRFPECDFALWDRPTGKTCPKCGSLLIESNKKIKCSNKERENAKGV